MNTHTSKLTSKYRATIPKPVRRLLKLQVGDSIIFDIEGEVVQLRKARPVDLAVAKSLESFTLSEWASAADEDAYREL